MACVSGTNVNDPLGVYRYFRDILEMRYPQFIPIVERDNATCNQKGGKISSTSISGREFGNFLISIFDEWAQNDVSEVFVQLFETCPGVWPGFPASLCIFTQECGA